MFQEFLQLFKDKELVELLKTDSLIIGGLFMYVLSGVLFTDREYIFSLVYFVTGSFVIYLRTLRKHVERQRQK